MTREPFHQGSEGEGLRSDGVHDPVAALFSLVDGDAGEIVDIDGLDPVTAVSENAEEGEPPEDPGDVVDEDILTSEEDRRPQDRPAYSETPQLPLQERLPPEIFQR